jgi:hypothetical protein
MAKPESSAQGLPKPRKSVLVSGLLSFLFGPAGWLYAAPWQVALPGAAAYVLACSILPHVLIVYLLMVVAPLSSIAGVVYALGFNSAGHRIALFGKENKRLGS